MENLLLWMRRSLYSQKCVGSLGGFLQNLREVSIYFSLAQCMQRHVLRNVLRTMYGKTLVLDIMQSRTRKEESSGFRRESNLGRSKPWHQFFFCSEHPSLGAMSHFWYPASQKSINRSNSESLVNLMFICWMFSTCHCYIDKSIISSHRLLEIGSSHKSVDVTVNVMYLATM